MECARPGQSHVVLHEGNESHKVRVLADQSVMNHPVRAKNLQVGTKGLDQDTDVSTNDRNLATHVFITRATSE
jgi:hypothetical protein